MILGRAPQHRRSADVDIFNRLVQRRAGLCHRRLEWIEVHHHQVEGLDAVRLQLRQVLGLALVGQDPAVDARMERFDPAF